MMKKYVYIYMQYDNRSSTFFSSCKLVSENGLTVQISPVFVGRGRVQHPEGQSPAFQRVHRGTVQGILPEIHIRQSLQTRLRRAHVHVWNRQIICV